MSFSLFSKAKIAQLQDQIGTLQAELLAAHSQVRSVFEYGMRQSQLLGQHYGPLLDANVKTVRKLLDDYPLTLVAGWEDSRWNAWVAQDAREENILRFGDWSESSANSLRVPGFLPFKIGRAHV